MSKRNDEVAVEDARKHPFYIVDNDVIAVHGPQMGVYGVAVYNVLAYYANNKEGAWPSYQTIADHLNVSRPKVITTIKLLVSLGLVAKSYRVLASGDNTSNRYVLADIHAIGSKQDLPGGKPQIPPGSKQDLLGGKQRLPEQELVNKNYPSEQERVKGDAPPTIADDVQFGKSDPPKPLTAQQEMYGAICEALGWDYHVIAEQDKVQVAQAVKALSKASYTVADIRRFMTETWFLDYRWTEKRSFPSLSQLRQGIGKLRAGVPEPVPRASPTQSTSRVAASLAAIDEYERIKASHGVAT